MPAFEDGIESFVKKILEATKNTKCPNCENENSFLVRLEILGSVKLNPHAGYRSYASSSLSAILQCKAIACAECNALILDSSKTLLIPETEEGS